MFTGIVGEIGRVGQVRRLRGVLRLGVEAPDTAASLGIGGSVAIAGVCQTVVAVGGGLFVVEVVPETLRRTTLGNLCPGDEVNLELPLAMGDPLGGQLVAGHVDGVGVVARLERGRKECRLTVSLPRGLGPLVVEKGSLAVDGVSLTVASRRGGGATVALIPHTLKSTTLGRLRTGSRVNLEADTVARQLAGLHEAKQGSSSRITVEWLRDRGYAD